MTEFKLDQEEIDRKLSQWIDARNREDDAASEASMLAEELADMGVDVDEY